MDVTAPVSTIMSTDLKILQADDALEKAKALFEQHNIHHIPVVGFKEIVGILSETDLMHFLRGFARGKGDELLEQTRLRAWKVKEIMNKNLNTLTKDASIMEALEVFKLNQIHCIPILEEKALVGIITPHDIILKLVEEGRATMRSTNNEIPK